MKIGELVKNFVPSIIEYCENVDLGEINRLCDEDYCKKTLDINYPFWVYSNEIDSSERYWSKSYKVNENSMRVCNDWYTRNIEVFKNYLIDKRITTKEALEKIDIDAAKSNNNKLDAKVRSNSRYKGNAIGNAQNLLIRNILSNLGDDAFNESNWIETKKYFNNCCAYCGANEKLVIEHAIPINKTMLGEHRLGNIIPSCHSCNSKKGSMNFEEFLVEQPEKIQKIKDYMNLHSYEPLNQSPLSEKIALLLDNAYLDTADVAKRYIHIIELFLNEEAI